MSGRQAQPQRLAPRPLRRGAVVGHQLYRQQLPIRSLSAYTPPPRCAGLRDAAGPCRRIWSRPARRRGPDRRSRWGRRRSGRLSGATVAPRPAVPRAAPSMPPAPARGCASGSRAGALTTYCCAKNSALGCIRIWSKQLRWTWRAWASICVSAAGRQPSRTKSHGTSSVPVAPTDSADVAAHLAFASLPSCLACLLLFFLFAAGSSVTKLRDRSQSRR